MTDRAQRMAAATRLPMLDRRAAVATGALDAGGVAIPRHGDAEIVVDGRRIALTSLDRILWPATGFTKAELVAYYLSIAPVMLPHLRGRAITAGRFPGGVDGRGFAQTEMPGRPGWLETVPLRLGNGALRRFTIVSERAALVWLAQMGTVELHAFPGALPDLERPATIVFDLDPAPPAGLVDAARVAARLCERLRAGGVAGRAKTSGSAGMHVLVPTGGMLDYDGARAGGGAVARDLVAELPGLVTDRMTRDRAGRVLIDVRQNSRRLTTVVAYSLRATSRPTVSAPVAWEEVDAAVVRADARGLVFEAGHMAARVARIGDPMAALAAG